jgi:HEAT repeat protein
MKARWNKTVTLAAIILMAVLLSTNTFAFNLFNNHSDNQASKIPEKFIKNLAIGIQSENDGLKKSCIYYAGFYEIDGLVEPLIAQLQKEHDANTKVLIVLALYKIGNEEGIKAVENLVKNEDNPHVKKIAAAVLNEFQFLHNSDFTQK